MNSQSVWAEINTGAIARNVQAIRQFLKPDTRLLAVVKSNAYGHGIIKTAECVLDSGADALGVARIPEGICLREAGIDAPVLIFGFTPPSLARELIKYNLTQTVHSCDAAKELSKAANTAGGKISVHIKIDTGMGRLGLFSDCIDEFKVISRLSGLYIEGIYTHFATADSNDKTYANKQFRIFNDILNTLHAEGFDIPLKHAANSAATVTMPEAHLDMVRCGIMIYGLYPSGDIKKNSIIVKPAMTFKTKVICLKKVPAGSMISYGAFYKTKKPTNIITVSAGYGDGLNRLLSSCGHMLIHGQRVKIAGRICMDMTMLDAGNIQDIRQGDEVVIFGDQGEASISVDEIASITDTINYEVLTSVSQNVYRKYYSA